jgi:hypothetical protein
VLTGPAREVRDVIGIGGDGDASGKRAGDTSSFSVDRPREEVVAI